MFSALVIFSVIALSIAFHDDRFVFHVFENIDSEHTRAWQQRPTADKTKDGEGRAKYDERGRPPGAEREKKIFPAPRYVHSRTRSNV